MNRENRENSVTASAGRKMWEGVIAVEGNPTGDGRMMARGSLYWQDLPITLAWAKEDQGEHLGAVTVGRVLEIWRDGDNIMARGDIDLGSDEGIELSRLVEGDEDGPIMNGVSVDLDDVDVELRLKSEMWQESEAEEEPEADVSEDEDEVEPAEETETEPTEEQPEEIAVAEEKDEEGRVKVYEEKVEDELMVITEARIRGLTAVRIPAFAEARIFVTDESVEEMEEMPDEEDELIASSAPVKPPSSWFENPNFGSSPSSDPRLVKDPNTGVVACPVTVTEDGRLFGHIAPWKACHTAYAECVSPPASSASYQYFHTGVVDTSDGKQIPVGHMTMNTTHAGRKLGAVDTAFHYENTGMVVADVRAGEDQYGIWVSGALRPHLTAEQVREFKSAPPSGDWRRVGGSLELVAVLAVNAPGFMVPRAMVASGSVKTLQTAVPTKEPGPSKESFELTPQMLALKAKVHMRTLRLQVV